MQRSRAHGVARIREHRLHALGPVEVHHWEHCTVRLGGLRHVPHPAAFAPIRGADRPVHPLNVDARPSNDIEGKSRDLFLLSINQVGVQLHARDESAFFAGDA